MSNLLILPPSGGALSGDGLLVGNLNSPDPREVWIAPNAASVSFRLDFGGRSTIDTVFLGHASLTRPASFTVTFDGAAIGGADFVLPRVGGRPAHGLLAMPGRITGQVLVVTIALDPADAPLRLGIVMAETSFRPVWPQEYGSGRSVIDTGTRDRLQGGGFAIDPGVRKAGWQWTLGDLTDAELETLYALVLDRGETRPVLVVEDYSPARSGLCERIHYGAFDRLEAFERRDVSLNRWSLRIEDWL